MMGFFDRFAAKKNNPANPPPATPPTPETKSEEPVESVPESIVPAPTSTASVKAQLIAAREKLEDKDVEGAMAIYEELLRTGGDRADVLVTLSGDLGTCGYVEQIVELVAPRYDAERHGPATGINLLQAYLALHHTDAAQHLLDILFALNRRDLEERLHGFSNALAEQLAAARRGQLAPMGSAPNGAPEQKPNVVNLVTVSKPIWAYGIDSVPGLLPAPKSDRARRIAFAQLALLEEKPAPDKTKQPDDELGRFSRGFPLWMAEMMYFSPHYAPIAALGTMNKEHYVTFQTEWSAEHIRQLLETNKSPIDYVFIGSLRTDRDDFELSLKLWEVKRSRERKQFLARWTPATADAELAKFAEGLRLFMEWAPLPKGAGLAYRAPDHPRAWCDTLGSSLSLFLADKGVLPKSYLEPAGETLPRLAARATQSELDSLAYLTAVDRSTRLDGGAPGPLETPLYHSPLVEEARGLLNL